MTLEDVHDFFGLIFWDGLDFSFFTKEFQLVMLCVAPGSEKAAQAHGDGPSSGPAARANGTVRPSDIPMTISRTSSPPVKCVSV